MSLVNLAGRRAPVPLKVGLVLGAGGITGVAWLAGALKALQQKTGWDPSTADVIAGTSAGAIVAAVLGARRDPVDLLPYAEDPALLRAAIDRAITDRPGERFAFPLPGSLRLGVAGLATTNWRERVSSLSGFLPRGMRPTDEIRGLTHEAVAAGWPTHTDLWLHSWDVREGRLVTFGALGAPEADLADAVAASCAVPSYYRPVRIDGRVYVDGGLRSFTNADRLTTEKCDTVVCLTPFSTRDRGPWLDTAVFGAVRTATAARTERELRRLRDAGTQVVHLQPTGADIRAMGLNPMDRGRSRRVLETARASVAEGLDEQLRGVNLPTGTSGTRSRPKLRVVA
ncbi:patatin-like phospholipase family protein [Paraconexibacter sp.]|uniref:patatin-like phospholipase family protein n=1 Tax=Paraconexibacter sp. TaxID=2949640 RepID=UPI003567468F